MHVIIKITMQCNNPSVWYLVIVLLFFASRLLTVTCKFVVRYFHQSWIYNYSNYKRGNISAFPLQTAVDHNKRKILKIKMQKFPTVRH